MRPALQWAGVVTISVGLSTAACVNDSEQFQPLTGDAGLETGVTPTPTTTATTPPTGVDSSTATGDAAGADAQTVDANVEGGEAGDAALPPDASLDGTTSLDSGPDGVAPGDSGPKDAGDASLPVDAAVADSGLTKAGDNCSNGAYGARYRAAKLKADDGGFICDTSPLGPVPPETCFNDIDDNGDGHTDEFCSYCDPACGTGFHCKVGACVADAVIVVPPGAAGPGFTCPPGQTVNKPLGICR